MSSRIIVVSLVLALALACRSGGPSPSSDEGARSGSESSPAAPERIASRTVFADELLWALGDDVRARVVAVSPMADDARYSTVAGAWPEAVPRLGRNPEELLVLTPDLVILASFSAPEYRASIEDKLRVVVLDDFSGFAGYLDNVERIGAAVGAVDAATALRERFVTRQRALEAKRPAPGDRPSVVGWDYGTMPGSKTSFDDAATTAGFINLAAREGLVGHQRVDAEQLVAWDPRFIVIGCGEGPCAAARAKLAEQVGVGELGAVREGRVIAIEAPYLATTGEAMLELAARMQARLLETEETEETEEP